MAAAVGGAPPFTSRVNPKWDFDKQKWMVSLVNTGTVLGGHAIIVVEGVKENGNLFVRQFDILAREYTITNADAFQKSLGNVQGYISKIRIFKTYNNSIEYSQYSSENWYASPQEVKDMRRSIKVKQRTIAQVTTEDGVLLEGREPPYKYQMAGSKRLWIFGGNQGDNCVTWALKEIVQANILKNGDGGKKIDLIKAPPQAHVNWSPKNKHQV